MGGEDRVRPIGCDQFEMSENLTLSNLKVRRGFRPGIKKPAKALHGWVLRRRVFSFSPNTVDWCRQTTVKWQKEFKLDWEQMITSLKQLLYRTVYRVGTVRTVLFGPCRGLKYHI